MSFLLHTNFRRNFNPWNNFNLRKKFPSHKNPAKQTRNFYPPKNFLSGEEISVHSLKLLPRSAWRPWLHYPPLPTSSYCTPPRLVGPSLATLEPLQPARQPSSAPPSPPPWDPDIRPRTCLGWPLRPKSSAGTFSSSDGKEGKKEVTYMMHQSRHCLFISWMCIVHVCICVHREALFFRTAGMNEAINLHLPAMEGSVSTQHAAGHSPCFYACCSLNA